MLKSAGGESGASESWSWSLTTSSSRMESRLSINQTGTPLERHTPDLTITLPALVRGPTNLNFRVGRRPMPIRVQRGIGSVETTFNQRFNFWDTAHRVHLGEAIMSQRRHGI